jgi:hypothetical protein
MAITPGDPVRVLFLSKSPWALDPPEPLVLGYRNGKEGCYSTDFWAPHTVPLKAVYYDYGEVADVEPGLALDSFWAQFKSQLVEIPWGENSVHDVSTSKDMNWEQMWTASGAEGRMRYRVSDKIVPVCPVMIREDVWQAMLALPIPYKDHEYLEDGSYRTHPITLDYFTNKYLKIFESHLDSIKNSESFAIHNFRFRTLESLRLDNETYGTEKLAFHFDYVCNNSSELTDEVKKFCRSLAEIKYISILYSALRRTWNLGTGMGSQGTEFALIGQFHEAMACLSYRVAKHEVSQKMVRIIEGNTVYIFDVATQALGAGKVYANTQEALRAK